MASFVKAAPSLCGIANATVKQTNKQIATFILLEKINKSPENKIIENPAIKTINYTHLSSSLGFQVSYANQFKFKFCHVLFSNFVKSVLKK